LAHLPRRLRSGPLAVTSTPHRRRLDRFPTRWLLMLYALVGAGGTCGDRVWHRRISLTLPAASLAGGPATSRELQEAISIADHALVAHGIPPSVNAPGESDQAEGIIAAYGYCGLRLQGQRLTTGCVKMNGSPAAAKA